MCIVFKHAMFSIKPNIAIPEWQQLPSCRNLASSVAVDLKCFNFIVARCGQFKSQPRVSTQLLCFELWFLSISGVCKISWLFRFRHFRLWTVAICKQSHHFLPNWYVLTCASFVAMRWCLESIRIGAKCVCGDGENCRLAVTVNQLVVWF